jgi:hypothetical protein
MGFWLINPTTCCIAKGYQGGLAVHVFKSERFLVQRVNFDAPVFAGLGV